MRLALAFGLAFALVLFGPPDTGTPAVSHAAAATASSAASAAKTTKGRYTSATRGRIHPSKGRAATTTPRRGWITTVDWTGTGSNRLALGDSAADGGTSGGSVILSGSAFAAAMASSRGAFLRGPLASHLGIEVPATAVTIASVVPTPTLTPSPPPLSPSPPPPARVKVPVLMYHEIGDGPNELYVSVDSFAGQMDLLAKRGFTTVSLDQLYAALVQDGPLPEHPVVLTFDDGYQSAYEVVFPILKKHGFRGVFFVPTQSVGSRNRLTWDQLKEMQAGGMDIESHTEHHVDLEVISSDWTRLAQETSGARETLQSQLGTKVEYFCYPSGRYNDKVLEAVQAAGYKGAFTTKPGWTTSAQSPLEWRRIRINRSDSLAGFGSKLGLEP